LRSRNSVKPSRQQTALFAVAAAPNRVNQDQQCACDEEKRRYQRDRENSHGKPEIRCLDPEMGLAYLRLMVVRPILIAPDPRLKAVSEDVAAVDGDVRQLAHDMLESMYAADGIGLAAIQIGIPKRILVMDLARKDGKNEPRVFINPKILWTSAETAVCQEGCLSVPEIWEEVERPAQVRAEYLDRDGVLQNLEAEGLLATCLQHEIDHLEGILFVDHLSRLKRSMALKKLAKAQRLKQAS
jgi:peptide deformylase